MKYKGLILDLIHNIDVLDTLISNQVTKESDWHWFRQLKYEMKEKAVIIMCKLNIFKLIKKAKLNLTIHLNIRETNLN